jgi:predicted MFS family arabinose efflux permease
MTSLTKLLCLALGAFAIGTESYVVAGVLPTLAADLGVTVPVAGQLITAFALTYAIGSPLIAVATGEMERRRLLLISLAAFGAFNLVAALAHSYGLLLAARIGLGLSAGTFMPAASAYAVAATPAAQRGRALSIVFGGLTVALVVGAPIGVLLGGYFGWRFIFIGVAALTGVALAGLAFTLRRIYPDTKVTLAERIAIARRPDVLATLAVTTITLSGVYTIYAYLTPLLQQRAHLAGNTVAVVFFLFGLGSTLGNYLSGRTTDRIGPRRVLNLSLSGLSLLFIALSSVATFLLPETARWVIVPLIVLWGFVGWSFPSAQQAHIASLAPKLAPITLSLNSSAIYLGASLGALLGSIVVAHGSVSELGWVGALCEVGALSLLGFTRRRRTATEPAPRRLEEPVTESA